MYNFNKSLSKSINCFTVLRIDGKTINSNLPSSFLDDNFDQKYLQNIQYYTILNHKVEFITYTDLKAIKELVYMDSKTGVLSHCGFVDNINDWIEEQKNFILCMFDIDDFKKYNDLYGHDVGDKVLVDVVNCFKHNLKSTDLVGRYGGDEFILAIEGMSLECAKARMKQIMGHLRSGMHFEDSTIYPTVSIGLLDYDLDKSYEDNFRDVDLLLYQSKKAGKNTITASKSKDTSIIGIKTLLKHIQ